MIHLVNTINRRKHHVPGGVLLRSASRLCAGLTSRLCTRLAAMVALTLAATQGPIHADDSAASSHSLNTAEAQDLFRTANAAYSVGEFRKAAESYSRLVAGGHHDARVYYNWGNALYRLGEPGEAALQYERALALEPGFAEARANLQTVRTESQARLTPLGWGWDVSQRVGIVTLTWITALAAWVALCAAVFLLKPGANRPAWIFVLVLALFVGGAGFVTILAAQGGRNNPRLAVTLPDSVSARFEPVRNAKEVLPLPAGSRVLVETVRGPWAYVALPGNLLGWVPSDTIGYVVPKNTPAVEPRKSVATTTDRAE